MTERPKDEGRQSEKIAGLYLPPIHRLRLPKTTTQTALVRWLTALGYTVVEIHKGTGIKYQQVRNMATSQPKRASREDLPPLKIEVLDPVDDVQAIMDAELERSLHAGRKKDARIGHNPEDPVFNHFDGPGNEDLDDENYNR